MSGLWPTAALAYLTLALITDSCSGNGVRVLGMLNVDRALFQPLLSASIVGKLLPRGIPSSGEAHYKGYK